MGKERTNKAAESPQKPFLPMRDWLKAGLFLGSSCEKPLLYSDGNWAQDSFPSSKMLSNKPNAGQIWSQGSQASHPACFSSHLPLPFSTCFFFSLLTVAWGLGYDAPAGHGVGGHLWTQNLEFGSIIVTSQDWIRCSLILLSFNPVLILFYWKSSHGQKLLPSEKCGWSSKTYHSAFTSH